MAFVLVLKPSARKALDSLGETDRRKALLVLEAIERDPYGGKKLQGDLHRQYSVHAWPYRVVYEIFKRELVVIVIKIGHRQGVYKK